VQEALRHAGSRNLHGDDWQCVGHDDKRASLTVKNGDDPGKVVLACGAGCGTNQILSALGLTVRDLFDNGGTDRVPVRVPYVYGDKKNNPLYRVVRVQSADGSKRFTQEASDGQGGWRRGRGAMEGVDLVLFHLPQVRKAAKAGQVVHVVEGEKDVLTLEATGVVATTKPGGANKPWSTGYTKALRGASEVVVWADRDPVGYRSAHATVSALLVAGLPARAVLPVPDAPHDDVTDHLTAGHGVIDANPVTLDELLALAGGGEQVDDVLNAVQAEFLAQHDKAEDHLADLLTDEGVAKMEPIECVIDGWVPMGTYTVIYGAPGVGKTLALLGMTRAVRKGTRWQDHSTLPGATVYYQGEGVRQFKDRIDAWDAAYPTREDQAMRAGAYTERIVDLTKPEGVAAVIRTVRRYGEQSGVPVRLLVIDPLVEFMTGEENGEGMERASRGLRALAKLLDIGVVVGHHSNASGERERGAAFLRMRAGAFVRMENLDDAGQSIGLFQHKQRNGAKVALTLGMRESEDSVVLEYTGAMLAEDYVAQKEGAKRRQRDSMKADQKRLGEVALLQAVTASPGIAKDALIKACRGCGVGSPVLEEIRSALVTIGTLRVEEGARGAQKHYLRARSRPTPSHPRWVRVARVGHRQPPPTPALIGPGGWVVVPNGGWTSVGLSTRRKS